MRSIIALLFIGALSLGAQTLYNYPKDPSVSWTIIPQAVPSSPADVVKVDVYVDQIHLANTTAGSLTCTINDKQASPIALTPGAVTVAANTLFVIPLNGRWAPGGVNWVCSGSGVIGWMSGSRRLPLAVVLSTVGVLP